MVEGSYGVYGKEDRAGRRERHLNCKVTWGVAGRLPESDYAVTVDVVAVFVLLQEGPSDCGVGEVSANVQRAAEPVRCVRVLKLGSSSDDGRIGKRSDGRQGARVV